MPCANKYSKLSDACLGGPSLAPFGSNAVFRPGSALFDPYLANGADAAALFNCSALGAPPQCPQLFGSGEGLKPLLPQIPVVTLVLPQAAA